MPIDSPPCIRFYKRPGLTHGKGMQSYLCMMGIRLVEMRRVLKDTGSIYLHCDPTASHYLKAMLDAIFGHRDFRSEIVWKRSGGKSDASRWGVTTDRILFYSKSDKYIWNRQYQAHNPDYIAKTYRHNDNDGRGRYTTMPLHASGLRGGESGLPWRGYSPEESGNHWRTPTKGVINAYIREHNLIKGWPDAFPTIQARLEALDNAGFIVWSANGVPRVKMHLAATKGVAATDLIIDVPMASGKERLGYPTQKPLDLLERIIKASSNDGSVVLDPFCGCATALIASEKLERQWVGIDLSHKAVELVHDRLEREVSIGPIYHSMVTARTDFLDGQTSTSPQLPSESPRPIRAAGRPVQRL